MQRMVAAAIRARRVEGPSATEDLLDYMIRARDPETGRTMTPQDLLHNMQFFIVAGHETTALALSWALYLLANEAEVQGRAHAEAHAVLGSRAAGAADLEAMPYCRSVLEEAMRLYPLRAVSDAAHFRQFIPADHRNIIFKGKLFALPMLSRPHQAQCHPFPL